MAVSSPSLINKSRSKLPGHALPLRPKRPSQRFLICDGQRAILHRLHVIGVRLMHDVNEPWYKAGLPVEGVQVSGYEHFPQGFISSLTWRVLLQNLHMRKAVVNACIVTGMRLMHDVNEPWYKA